MAIPCWKSKAGIRYQIPLQIPLSTGTSESSQAADMTKAFDFDQTFFGH